MSSIVLSLISRLRLALHRHGVRGTIGKVEQRVRESLYFDRTWIWYELPLGADRLHASLPPGLVLTRGGASEASLLHELPLGNKWRARRWLGAGNDLWLVLDEGRPVFACMSFHGSTPTASRSGRLAPAPVRCSRPGGLLHLDILPRPRPHWARCVVSDRGQARKDWSEIDHHTCWRGK